MTSPTTLAARLGCDPSIFTAGWEAARSAGPVSDDTAARCAALLNRSTVPVHQAAA